jgi:hypothetical protein
MPLCNHKTKLRREIYLDDSQMSSQYPQLEFKRHFPNILNSKPRVTKNLYAFLWKYGRGSPYCEQTCMLCCKRRKQNLTPSTCTSLQLVYVVEHNFKLTKEIKRGHMC